MTKQDFGDLRPGDVIFNHASRNTYLVVAALDDGRIAVIPCSIFENEFEWEKIPANTPSALRSYEPTRRQHP